MDTLQIALRGTVQREDGGPRYHPSLGPSAALYGALRELSYKYDTRIVFGIKL